MDFKLARKYERDYHNKLYAEHALNSPGTWLHKPASYVIKSFELIPIKSNICALDLGGGVGRHSIPLAKYLGSTSEVICVDLLSSAIDQLNNNIAEYGTEDIITGIVEDVETYKLGDKSYDYILSVSCIEHLPTQARLIKLIKRLQVATLANGIHCFMIITDNEWINRNTNEALKPIVEQNLSSDVTIAMLKNLYADWQIVDVSTKAWQANQLIEDEDVILKSTCVQFTAKKLQNRSQKNRAQK